MSRLMQKGGVRDRDNYINGGTTKICLLG